MAGAAKAMFLPLSLPWFRDGDVVFLVQHFVPILSVWFCGGMQLPATQRPKAVSRACSNATRNLDTSWFAAVDGCRRLSGVARW